MKQDSTKKLKKIFLATTPSSLAHSEVVSPFETTRTKLIKKLIDLFS